MINVVNLGKGQVLTKQEIRKILNSSRATYQYAKFRFHGNFHITIVYHKDLTITVATNSRDIALYKEIQSLERIYTQQRVIDFLFRWINKLTR